MLLYPRHFVVDDKYISNISRNEGDARARALLESLVLFWKQNAQRLLFLLQIAGEEWGKALSECLNRENRRYESIKQTIFTCRHTLHFESPSTHLCSTSHSLTYLDSAGKEPVRCPEVRRETKRVGEQDLMERHKHHTHAHTCRADCQLNPACLL